jgi:hypothetical protein
VLRLAGHKVVATDIKDGAYGCPYSKGGVDFLEQMVAPEGITTVLTNPPYMHADEFVRHALTLAPRVVMLLPLTFLAGQDRADILEGGHLARIWVFRNRVRFHYHGGDESKKGDRIPTAWFVWDRDHHGSTEFRFISWEADDGDEAVGSEMPDIPEAAE